MGLETQHSERLIEAEGIFFYSDREILVDEEIMIDFLKKNQFFFSQLLIIGFVLTLSSQPALATQLRQRTREVVDSYTIDPNVEFVDRIHRYDFRPKRVPKRVPKSKKMVKETIKALNQTDLIGFLTLINQSTQAKSIEVQASKLLTPSLEFVSNTVQFPMPEVIQPIQNSFNNTRYLTDSNLMLKLRAGAFSKLAAKYGFDIAGKLIQKAGEIFRQEQQKEEKNYTKILNYFGGGLIALDGNPIVIATLLLFISQEYYKYKKGEDSLTNPLELFVESKNTFEISAKQVVKMLKKHSHIVMLIIYLILNRKALSEFFLYLLDLLCIPQQQ